MSNSQALRNVFKLHDVVNIKDPAYGARGDGTTDDTAAITAAIAAGSNLIYVPPGTYLTTGGHTITTQRFVGSGKGLTIIKRGSGTTTLFTLLGIGSVEDLTLDGNTLNGHGIIVSTDAATYKTGSVRNVKFQNFGATVVTKTITGASLASQCVVTATGHGFSVGYLVSIKSVTGLVSASNPQLCIINNTYRITAVTTDTFTITEITTGGYTAYSAGGTAERASYALCVEQVTGGFAAHGKTFADLEFSTNYGDIYLGYTNNTRFTNVLSFGDRDGYFVYVSNLDVIKVTFDRYYAESGIGTANYGIRDLTFRDGSVLLSASNAWDRPWFQSIGMNEAAGSQGSEVAQLEFDGLQLRRDVNDAALAIFDINNYQISFRNLHILETASTAWSVFRDRGTYDLKIEDLTVESTNAWMMFSSGSAGALFTQANNVNYTQGVIGDANWSSENITGDTTGHISVKNSNLNHSVHSPLDAREFWFENIAGTLDLTNASAGSTVVFNITGTITDPNGAIAFNNRTSGVWTTPGFSSGNFTASASMTWTVAAQVTYAYSIVNRVMTICFSITGTVGGTPDTDVRIAIPASKLPSVTAYNATAKIVDNATNVAGLITATGGNSYIAISRLDNANYTAGAVTVNGSITFPIS